MLTKLQTLASSVVVKTSEIVAPLTAIAEVAAIEVASTAAGVGCSILGAAAGAISGFNYGREATKDWLRHRPIDVEFSEVQS